MWYKGDCGWLLRSDFVNGGVPLYLGEAKRMLSYMLMVQDKEVLGKLNVLEIVFYIKYW